MKSISLTDSEINHIRETYSQELKQLQKRSEEIAEILKKLKSNTITETEPTVKESKKNQEKLSVQPLKRGRKSTKIKEEVTLAENKPEKKGKRGRPAKKAEKVVATPTEKAVVAAPKEKAKRGRKPKVSVLEVNTVVKTKRRGRPAKAEKTAKPEKPVRVKKATKKAVSAGKRGRKKAVKAPVQSESTEVPSI
jgi:hypothetical protein